MIHNENSRVKIPAIAHLTRLGYTYLPLKQCKDEVCQDTNIFRSLFQNAVNQLNGRNLSAAEIDRLVAELTIKLSNDDLGRAFYKILLDGMDGLRLIDLDDMSRNTYHVVTELPYQNGEDMSGILNIALDQIEFTFRKVSESEMVIADQYQDTLEKTRRELERSLDPKDPEYITLLEELKRIFKKKNIEELTADEMQQQIQDLERIRKTAAQQNLRDQMLCAKYGGDAKYMRTHKRIKASPPPIGSDPVIFDILMGVKTAVDQKVLKNQRIMDNHAYFTREIMPTIIQSCRNNGVQPSMAQVNFIDTCISGEYFAERTWIS